MAVQSEYYKLQCWYFLWQYPAVDTNHINNVKEGLELKENLILSTVLK